MAGRTRKIDLKNQTDLQAKLSEILHQAERRKQAYDWPGVIEAATRGLELLAHAQAEGQSQLEERQAWQWEYDLHAIREKAYEQGLSLPPITEEIYELVRLAQKLGDVALLVDSQIKLSLNLENRNEIEQSAELIRQTMGPSAAGSGS